MADYKLNYTGAEIDEAISRALDSGVATVDLTAYDMPTLGIDFGVQSVALTSTRATALRSILEKRVVIMAVDVELEYKNIRGNMSNVYSGQAMFATYMMSISGDWFGVCELVNGMKFKVELIGTTLTAVLTSASGDTGGSVG